MTCSWSRSPATPAAARRCCFAGTSCLPATTCGVTGRAVWPLGEGSAGTRGASRSARWRNCATLRSTGCCPGTGEDGAVARRTTRSRRSPGCWGGCGRPKIVLMTVSSDPVPARRRIKEMELLVAEVVVETHDTTTLVLSDSHERFEYRAGHFL